MSDESTKPDLASLTRELVEAQGVDATMRFFGPASVYDLSVLGLEVFEGYSAIRDFFEDWLSSYDETADVTEEVTEFGNGVVLAVIRGQGRPAGSPTDVQVHARRSAVAVWDNELIARVTIYRGVDEARAAAERLAQERADG
jgi:hypothetical protein